MSVSLKIYIAFPGATRSQKSKTCFTTTSFPLYTILRITQSRAQNCKQFTNSQSSKLHQADYQIEDMTNILYLFQRSITSSVSPVLLMASARVHLQAIIMWKANSQFDMILFYISNSYFDFFLRGLFLETAVLSNKNQFCEEQTWRLSVWLS